MDYVVTVQNSAKDAFKYWVEAKNMKEAEARGFRLHCASENFKADGGDRVKECRKVG